MASRLARGRGLVVLMVALVALLTAGCASPQGPIDAARRFDQAVAAGDRSGMQTVAGGELDFDDPAFVATASARRGFGDTAAEYSANIAAPQASVEVLLPAENARFAVELVEDGEGRWTVVSYAEMQDG